MTNIFQMLGITSRKNEDSSDEIESSEEEEDESEDDDEEESNEPDPECSFQYDWDDDENQWRCRLTDLDDGSCPCDKSICPLWKENIKAKHEN